MSSRIFTEFESLNISISDQYKSLDRTSQIKNVVNCLCTSKPHAIFNEFGLNPSRSERMVWYNVLRKILSEYDVDFKEITLPLTVADIHVDNVCVMEKAIGKTRYVTLIPYALAAVMIYVYGCSIDLERYFPGGDFFDGINYLIEKHPKGIEQNYKGKLIK